jgi:hypothetical protein
MRVGREEPHRHFGLVDRSFPKNSIDSENARVVSLSVPNREDRHNARALSLDAPELMLMRGHCV